MRGWQSTVGCVYGVGYCVRAQSRESCCAVPGPAQSPQRSAHQGFHLFLQIRIPVIEDDGADNKPVVGHVSRTLDALLLKTPV